MSIHESFTQKKELYDHLLMFIDNSSMSKSDDEELIKNIKITEGDREEFEHFLLLLISIINNHHRNPVFFNKIEQIILYLKDKIKQTMSNIEIYKKFESNKRAILILIKNEIIILDENIAKLIKNKKEINGMQYSDFFIPELIKFSESNDTQNNNLFQYSKDELDYEEKRQQGENDSYICSLIRQDSVEEFISYINKSSIPITATIKPSIFETNSFLNEHEPTLIEYAAFFGSIQIFQFLYMNNAKIRGLLWQYAIHSDNSELLVHHIESKEIKPDDVSFEECLKESIKCHHNDIADYIQNNLIDENQTESKNITTLEERVLEISFKNCNYSFFPTNFDQNCVFFYMHQYNFTKAFDLLLESKKEYIQSTIINYFYFHEIFNIKFIKFEFKSLNSILIKVFIITLYLNQFMTF